ncbi:MAG: hypothetical protein MZV49_20095 [Rhodopseudomonas palustris]|nr:hypothetical protein [Rhodopseudomonas palustris]
MAGLVAAIDVFGLERFQDVVTRDQRGYDPVIDTTRWHQERVPATRARA